MRKVLVPAGLLLAAFLIWRLGPATVWGELAHASWPGFVLVVAAYILQQTLGSVALWLLGTAEGGAGWRGTSFARLARVRFVGEVINYAMPTGGIGGEPYKLIVLGKAEGRHRALEALSAAKFLHIAAIGPFAATVFFLAWSVGAGRGALATAFLFLGLCFVLMTAAVWMLVLYNLLSKVLLGAYYRFRRLVPRPLRGFRVLLQLDRAAAKQVGRSPARSAAAYILYMGMWWAAALEWVAIAGVLGTGWRSLGLGTGGLFECASIIVALVPMPAGMGTQEAGKMALAEMLGYAASLGLAMSLVRRAREMLMVAAGAAFGLFDWGRGKG